MPNNINSSLTSYRQVKGPTDSNRTPEKANTQPNPSATAAADTVAVTTNARQLASLESAIASASVEDTSRIDAVRQQISDGTYEVDPQRVADSLLSMDQSLPSKF
ncbi:MAG: flagellar biosynthesis anti-sigma factor FlgM [Gammaproteobacteria bacterium]